MKKFVKIVNNTGVAVVVTKGLTYLDTTNRKSSQTDRIGVKPTWTRMRVKIETGSHWYPAEVADWNDVKALAVKDKLTVAERSDGERMPAEELEKATKMLNELTKTADKNEKAAKKNAEDLALDNAVRAEI